MNHLDEWHPLSLRYGFVSPADLVWQDRLPWGARHASVRADARVHHWCRCPGGRDRATPCALPVTQEDGLCDECRQWCVAVDREGAYHLIADLGGAA